MQFRLATHLSPSRKIPRIVVALVALLSSLVFLAVPSAQATSNATVGPITTLSLSNSTLTEQNGQVYYFDATFVSGSVTSTDLTATFASGTVTWANGANSGALTTGVSGTIPLARGNNSITVTHSESSTNTVYRIFIARAGQFTNLQILSPGITLTPAWDPAVRNYTLTNVPYSTTSIDYVATESYDEAGHLECDRCDWWQYNSRGTQRMTLTNGLNRITWHHYANPGYYAGPEDYIIEITREGPFDNTHLTGLTLSNSTLTEQTGQLYKFDGSIVASATTRITSTFTQGTAQWSANGSSGSLASGTSASVSLLQGNNTVLVTHTLAGVNTVYTIYVARPGVFSNFQVQTAGVTLTPAWDPAVTSYTLTNVPYSVTSIDYIVTESFDTAGYLECDHCDWWQYNSRGTQQMTLSTGANRITWHHYGGGGYNTDYTMDIVRGDVFDNTHLTNLTLSNSTLTEQSGQLYKFSATGLAGNIPTTGITASFSAGTATWTSGGASGAMTSGVAASVPVARGNNTISITYVRSGVTTMYTVYISRDGRFTEFRLINDNLTLTPAWNPAIHYYQISDVSLATNILNYVVTESYDEPGHLECDHCDWWQYNSRGTQQMTLTTGANCIRWSHYAGPGYYTNPEYYYIAINRGAPGTAPTGLCDPSSATTTTTSSPSSSTSSTTTPISVTTSTLAPRTSSTIANSDGNQGGISNSTETTVAQGQADVAKISTNSTVAPRVDQTTQSSSTTVVSATTTTTVVPDVVATKSGVEKPAPVVASLQNGETALAIGGKKIVVTVNRSMNQLILSGGGITMTVSALTVNNERVPLDDVGNLRFRSTDKIVVTAEGVAPGEDISMWFFSTPTEIGTVKADASGKMSGTFELPEGIENGNHRLVLQGSNFDGSKAVFGLAVTVGMAKETSTLSRVLIAIPIALAIGLGILLPTRARRRRRNALA